MKIIHRILLVTILLTVVVMVLRRMSDPRNQPTATPQETHKSTSTSTTINIISMDATAVESGSAPLPIRIVSHNIRYATTRPFKGEELWPKRLPLLVRQLFHLSLAPHTLISLQEVLHTQLTSIISALPHLKYIGVARDDGATHGEFSPVLYNPSEFEVVEWKTTWLSETPDRAGQKPAWDAGCQRILTHGVFKETKTGREVVAMSTHLDDRGKQARSNSADIILKVMDTYTKRGYPILLAGDFNSPPDDEAYKKMHTRPDVSDLRDLVDGGRRYGDEYTFTGFDGKGGQTRIDFLFVRDGTSKDELTANVGKAQELLAETKARGKGKWEAKGYAVLPNVWDEGVFVSDHRAVVGDLVLH